jgi:sec-independent protein translocase protein TatC
MARVLKRPNLPSLPFGRGPKSDEPYEDVFEEMTLAEHLDELRSRIVKTCVAIGVAFIAGVALAGPLLDWIADKAQVSENGLDISSPTDVITVYFQIALYIAVTFAMPVIIWQFFGFLAPGLTRKEKRILYTSLPFVIVLGVGGAAYGLLVAAPAAFKFLSSWQTSVFSWDPDGQEVVTFFLKLMLGLAFAFEMPVVMFMLAKLNIVSPMRMRRFRKYAYILLLVVSAIITPSTDPVNMAIVALPLLALYEFGILISYVFARPSRAATA